MSPSHHVKNSRVPTIQQTGGIWPSKVVWWIYLPGFCPLVHIWPQFSHFQQLLRWNDSVYQCAWSKHGIYYLSITRLPPGCCNWAWLAYLICKSPKQMCANTSPPLLCGFAQCILPLYDDILFLRAPSNNSCAHVEWISRNRVPMWLSSPICITKSFKNCVSAPTEC